MNHTVFRYAIAILLFGHGIGHVVGYWGSVRRSWLFSKWLSDETTWLLEQLWMGVAVVLFALATLSFLDIGLAHTWWRNLAIGAALLSAVGLVVFWGTWPESTALFALFVDLVILTVLLLLDWPPEDAVGFGATVGSTAGGGAR